MQYKVPQNIDLEDKIVGPFTMKQFLYLFVGGFILYGWWNYSNTYVSPPPMTIFLVLAIPVGFLCFCMAVVKVNDRPFEIFLLNLFKFMFSPKQRKWITGYAPEAVIMLDPSEVKKKDEHVKSESDLDSLAKSLEQQTSEIRAQDAAKQLSAGPSGVKPQSINLSVSDVASVSQKQQQAHSTLPSPANKAMASQAPAMGSAPAPVKKGFLGF